MYKLGLIGGGFQHAPSSTAYFQGNSIIWAKNQILDHTFWIDDAIIEGVYAECPNKYFWLVESRNICPRSIEWVKNNSKLVSDSCRYLFTHNEEIYKLQPQNFRFIKSHCTWIENPQIYPKSKLFSIISSNKDWTAGHRKRLEWIEKLRPYADLFGRGFNEIDKKEQGLKDYYYSAVLENDCYNFYFSEKLLDVICCGCIPVVWSCDVSKFFNPKGMILLDDNFDIKDLTIERWYDSLPYIKENLEIATEFLTVEDEIWNKYLKDIV